MMAERMLVAHQCQIVDGVEIPALETIIGHNQSEMHVAVFEPTR